MTPGKKRAERPWPPAEIDMTPITPYQRAMTGDLVCDSCDYGPYTHKANEKAEKALGIPTTCLYGQNVYADFTALYNIINKEGEAPK